MFGLNQAAYTSKSNSVKPKESGADYVLVPPWYEHLLQVFVEFL